MGVNILYCIHELYSLEAVAVLRNIDEFKKSHEIWNQDFEDYRQAYTDHLEKAIYDYTVLSCCGESRHAKSRSTFYNPHFPVGGERREAYKKAITSFTLTSLVKHIGLVFNPGHTIWAGGGYGGEPWHNIAMGAVNRNNYGSKIGFIDHMVDLSHNGGAYFDKNETNIFHMNGKSEYKEYLDYKASREPFEVVKKSLSSKSLETLIARGLNIGALPTGLHTRGYATESHDAVQSIMGYTPITWGKKDLPTEYLRTGLFREYYGKLEVMLDEIFPVVSPSPAIRHGITNDEYKAYGDKIKYWSKHFNDKCNCDNCKKYKEWKAKSEAIAFLDASVPPGGWGDYTYPNPVKEYHNEGEGERHGTQEASA